MTDLEAASEAPAWMHALEKKRQRVHRLAHELGAGSPCLLCKDDCPGLDLHFWRKLCRNCKCKKEDHDVIDEYGMEQFEILLGSSPNRPKKAFLDMLEMHTSAGLKNNRKNVAFDWVPPDVSPVIAAEYMQSLPASKLPISGSDGALYRRQQLERQLPLHDLDASQCHQLTESEVENLKKYLENVKSNVVGQGRVTKLQVPTSTSLDSLQKMCSFNSVPKPFQLYSGTNLSSDRPTQFTVGGQVSSGPAHFLKPPSAFLPKSISPEPFRSTTPDLPLSSVADRGAAFGVTLSPASQRMRLPPKSSTVGVLDGRDLDNLNNIRKQSSSVGNQNINIHPHDAQLLKEYTSNSVTQSSDVPGRMWVPADCVECAKKGLDGRLVHDRMCTHIVMSDGVPGQLHPGQIVPIECNECSREGLDGRLSRDQVCSHIANSVNIPHQVHSGQSIPPQCSDCSRKALGARLIRDQVCTHIANSDKIPHQVQSCQNNPVEYSDCMKKVDGQVMHEKVCTHIADSDGAPYQLQSGQITPHSRLECARKGPDGQLVSDIVCTHEAQSGDIPHHLQSGSEIPSDVFEYSRRGLDGKLVHDQVCALFAKADDVAGRSQSSQIISAACDCSGKGVDGQLVSDRICIHKPQIHDVAQEVEPSQLWPFNSNGNVVALNMDANTVLPGSVSSTAGSVQQNKNQDSIVPFKANSRTDAGAFPILNSAVKVQDLPSSSSQSNTLSSSGQDRIHARNKSPTGMMSVPGAPHTIALYAHNALNSPSGLDPQDSLSPNLASMSIDDNMQSLEITDSENNQSVDSDLPMHLNLNCAQCSEPILPGEVVVFADRAGSDAIWHPKCFVCNTCQELLVDLVYFFSKGHVYCGRHYADLLDIPRCSACDELIFVKEYTVAEGQAFHVKHFCCFECDDPLGGKQYVPKDDQPVCLPCYEQKYGKQCATCRLVIGAKDQGVTWKDLNWHATPHCFRCNSCQNSLLGGRFAVKDQRPFCSKECMQAGTSSNHQKVTSV